VSTEQRQRAHIVEAAARAAHEANRAWCLACGDTSQPAWDDAPEWQRCSAVNGVQAIIDDPTLTPKRLHESWLAQKRADGWLWGRVKDAANKLHPCMVPYHELPPEQRAKDAIFGAVVRAVLTAGGVLVDVAAPSGAQGETEPKPDFSRGYDAGYSAAVGDHPEWTQPIHSVAQAAGMIVGKYACRCSSCGTVFASENKRRVTCDACRTTQRFETTAIDRIAAERKPLLTFPASTIPEEVRKAVDELPVGRVQLGGDAELTCGLCGAAWGTKHSETCRNVAAPARPRTTTTPNPEGPQG
jgi:hypothetical protein